MVGNLLFADAHSLLFPPAVVRRRLVVVFRGYTDHAPQGLDHRVLRHVVVALAAFGELNPLGRLYYHIFPRLYRQTLGVKIIVLRSAAKADADYFCHDNWLPFYKSRAGPVQDAVSAAASAPVKCPALTLYPHCRASVSKSSI